MVKVNVEHCGKCASHARECRTLQRFLMQKVPGTQTECRIGRRGSFEVVVDGNLVHSKLKTLSFPDYDYVLQNVRSVSSKGGTIEKAKEQTTCAVM